MKTSETMQDILPQGVREYARWCLTTKHPRSYLIPLLHKLQHEEGYLKSEHVAEVARLFDTTPAEVEGVASFYNHFKLTPQGKHTVSVCLGTACHVRGAGAIADKLQELLGVSEGNTTEDGLFSFTAARCVGMCALAPVVIIDGNVFGSVTPEAVEGILKQFGFSRR